MRTIKLAFDATATPDQLVGAGYYVKEVLHELDATENIDLTIITRKSDKSRFREFAPNSQIKHVAPDLKPGRIFFQSFLLGKYVDDLNVDIFHGPHYQVPSKMKTKSVVTIHDMTLLSHKNVHTLAKAQFFSRIIPASIQRSSAILTVSQSTANDIEAITQTTKPIFVAPLGVDTQRFHPNKLQTDGAILKSRGIQGDYIGFLGLFEPRKSVPTLVEAFANVATKYPQLKLVLAGGQGWGSKEIRESIIQSGVSTRIITPGRLSHEEVAPFLRNCKIFVYPSVYEGFGMPVLEAMACGAPTITTNSSSLKEVGQTGTLLFEPEDVFMLEKLICSVLDDEKKSQELSNLAIERSKEFSWKRCSEIHVEAYESVMEF